MLIVKLKMNQRNNRFIFVTNFCISLKLMQVSEIYFLWNDDFFMTVFVANRELSFVRNLNLLKIVYVNFHQYQVYLFQVTSIGGMKYPFPRGFNPMVRPSFQTRGTNNRVPATGRGKKTSMKVIFIYNYVYNILN